MGADQEVAAVASLSYRPHWVLAGLMLLVGCKGGQEQTCLRQAMDATGLQAGVMSYTGPHGEERSVRQGPWPLAGVDASLPMASLTKPLVAHQVLRQIEAGHLRLDQSVAELLPVYVGPITEGTTIRNLLQHQAGYDRTKSDPLFASELPDCRQAARRVLSYSPEHLPGSRVIYSNAGYCVLGEVLLQHGWGGDLVPVLQAPLGAAGGWEGSASQLRTRLAAQLPLKVLPSAIHLEDGSYYGYGWRYWPQRSDLQWTHFGRLPGLVSIAASDGKQSMLVAHFSGDPADYEKMALKYVDAVTKCLQPASALLAE